MFDKIGQVFLDTTNCFNLDQVSEEDGSENFSTADNKAVPQQNYSRSMQCPPSSLSIPGINTSKGAELSQVRARVPSLNIYYKEPFTPTKTDLAMATAIQIGSILRTALPKVAKAIPRVTTKALLPTIAKAFSLKHTGIAHEKTGKVFGPCQKTLGQLKASVNLESLNTILTASEKIETELATFEQIRISTAGQRLSFCAKITLKPDAELQKLDTGYSDNFFLQGVEQLGLNAINTIAVAAGKPRFISTELDLNLITHENQSYLRITPSNLHVTHEGSTFEDPLIQALANNHMSKSYMSFDLTEKEITKTLTCEELGLEGTEGVKLKPTTIKIKEDTLCLELSLEYEPSVTIQADEDSASNQPSTETTSVRKELMDSLYLAKTEISLNLITLNQLIQEIKLDEETSLSDVQINYKDGRYLISGKLRQQDASSYKVKGIANFSVGPNKELRVHLKRLKTTRLGIDIKASTLYIANASGISTKKNFVLDIPLNDLFGEYQLIRNANDIDNLMIQDSARLMLDAIETESNKDQEPTLTLAVSIYADSYQIKS